MKFMASIRDFFKPAPSIMSSDARDRALIVLASHGYQAHYYLPHSGIDDSELSNALRFLGRNGFVITDRRGDLVGAVELAQSGSESRAKQQRAKFRLVE